MSTLKRVAAGCVLLPVLLMASCAGKVQFDLWRYELPGEILRSSASPTRNLKTALQVAQTLDTYVQPRFEILRENNFGISRIVYSKHAGLVQLKVDTPQEKEWIANVNAANRDYAISLLHCAPKPDSSAISVEPKLQLLYFNQQKIVRNSYYSNPSSERVAQEKGLNWESMEKKAIAALPRLMTGKEQHTADASWDILMQPVLASKQECLSCHTRANLGATLGVMVYSVGSTQRNTSARAGSQ